jgi:hypothetical protein
MALRNERTAMAASPARSRVGPSRSGLVTFAGVMFIVAGSFNLLDGVVALVNDDYYAADELLFGDLSAWGIWWLLVGGTMLVTGLLIIARRPLGAVFGICLASINALTQLMFLGVYPAWSIAVMVVDALIIYALTAHYEDFD